MGPNLLGFQYNYSYTPAGKVSSKALEVLSYNHQHSQGGYASGTVTFGYTYDNQGALTSLSYPGTVFSYTLDAMERPTGLTDSFNNTWASGATYNAANQPLNDGTATRTYNSLLQMTSIVAANMNMNYNYSSRYNNGQIISSTDNVSAETVVYTYDALKRLLSAVGGSWSETYTYDGYGNLTQDVAHGRRAIVEPDGSAGLQQRTDESHQRDRGVVRQ